jgi:hypothetical protein
MTASSTWFPLLGLVPLLVACSTGGDAYDGGQTGDEDTSGEGAGCDYVPTVVDLDEVTPLGFTAQEVLETALGSRVTPFFWKLGAHEYGPGSGESELTLELGAPAEARFMKGTPKESNLDIAVDCPDRVEVDVEVHARTADGALDETFVGPVHASSPELATLSHSFDVDELNGSFAFDAESLGAARVIAFRLNAVISEFGLSGGLEAQYELKSSDVASSYGQSLGVFPAEVPCSMGGVTVPLDAGPVSSRAALDLVESVDSIELLKTGETIAGELAIEHDGTPSCADLVGSWGATPTGVVSTGAVLHLKTSDGALDHDFPVRLESVPGEDGSLDHVKVTGSCETKEASAFAATCGDYGFDFTGYDGAMAALEITLRPGAGAPEVSGSLSVKGVIRPDCLDNPPPCTENGCPGCPGQTSEAVGTVLIQ